MQRWRLFPYMAAAAILRTFVLSLSDSYLSAVELSTTSEEIEDLVSGYNMQGWSIIINDFFSLV